MKYVIKEGFTVVLANLAFDMFMPYIFLLITMSFHIVYVYKGVEVNSMTFFSKNRLFRIWLAEDESKDSYFFFLNSYSYT